MTCPGDERIRAYLCGTMSPSQRATFETAMCIDPGLAETVDAERLLRIGLREIAARNAAAATGE